MPDTRDLYSGYFRVATPNTSIMSRNATIETWHRPDKKTGEGHKPLKNNAPDQPMREASQDSATYADDHLSLLILDFDTWLAQISDLVNTPKEGAETDTNL
jgi:hypothetical protein